MRSLVLVCLLYGLLSIYLFTHPTRVAAVLGTVPVVGQELSQTRLDPRDIQLTDVRGSYERVAGDELVFVVSGNALNNAPVPASGVQVQVRLLGPQEVRQTVFAGAAPHDVHDLSAREIDLLQTLRPPKEWTLAPGQQSPFTVAFRQPPKPLHELTAEVVAVRRAAKPR
jgi:hypothetical protein